MLFRYVEEAFSAPFRATKRMTLAYAPSVVQEIMAAGSIVSFYGSLSSKIVCIWLSVWAIRKKGEFDYPLDRTARAVRWLVVAQGFAMAYHVPGQSRGYVRLAGGFVGLAFLAGPILPIT